MSLTDIFEPTVTVRMGSKSVGNEASIAFLSEYRDSTDSAEMASVSLDDTQGVDQWQLGEVKIMTAAEDWIDRTGKLDTTGLISSALDSVMTSRWDASDTYGSHLAHLAIGSQSVVDERQKLDINNCDAPSGAATLSWSGTDPWAEAEDYIVIEAPDRSSHRGQSERNPDRTLPQDHPFLSPHSRPSLSFDEETRLLSVAMPDYAPSFWSCLDPALRSREGPDLPPPGASSTTDTHTHTHPRKRKRKRKQSTPDAALAKPKRGSPPPPPPARPQAKKSHPSSSRTSSQSKSHNATEKKYRHNLNGKLAILRLCVPSLCAASPTVSSEKLPCCTGASIGGGIGGAGSLDAHGDDCDDNSDNWSGGGRGDGEQQDRENAHAHRCTKATIIAKATEYILAQERDSKRLRADVVAYRSRIVAFEALEQSGVLSSSAVGRSAVGNM
jgi:hypothetical protein